MKKAVAYLRYSSDKQTEQSIEGQMHVCQAYAEQNGFLITHYYIDRALSAKTSENRVEFQQMLQDSAQRAWEVVLVYKLDRFARNKYEMAIHRKTLRDNGVKLISCMENIPDAPEGIILEALLEGMAEYYSAELAQKVKRGMRETRRKGLWTGGRLQFGYKVQDKRIVVDENEANIINQMFLMYAAGMSICEIYDHFNETGLLHNGKPLSHSALYRIFSDEKYIGKYTVDGEDYPDMYPRIISDELFNEAQKEVARNRYGKHRPGINYMLRDKMKCGYCGSNMAASTGTARNGETLRYYACMGQRKKQTSCTKKPVRKDLIEGLVTDAILTALGTDELITRLAKLVMEKHASKKANAVLETLRKELAEVQAAIKNMTKAIEMGVITNTTLTRLTELETQENDLKTKVALEESASALELKLPEVCKYIKKYIKKEPYVVIKKLVRQIMVYDDKIEVFLNYTNRAKTEKEGITFYETTATVEADRHLLHVEPKPEEIKVKVCV